MKKGDAIDRRILTHPPGNKINEKFKFVFFLIKVQQKGSRQQPFSTLFQAFFPRFLPQGQIRDLFSLATGALICGSQRFAIPHSITFSTSSHSRFCYFFHNICLLFSLAFSLSRIICNELALLSHLFFPPSIFGKNCNKAKTLDVPESF